MLLKNFVKSYLYCKLYKDLTKLFFNATWSPYINFTIGKIRGVEENYPT